MSDTKLARELGDEITIRRAVTIDDYRACQEAQKRAWEISDDSYLIPVATMVGANLHGGLVVGAFLPGGEAVAMSFAFLGRIEGRLCLYSQLTGVVPEHQSRGLGYQIKLFQRQSALSEGIDRIAWSFDPLQAGNAHFNLARLGAHARLFVENMYGPRTDRLSAGAPTDRLIAEWELATSPPAPLSFESVSELPRLLELSDRPHQGLVPVGLSAGAAFTGARVLLEVPIDITALRSEDPATAEKWRSLVAQAFQLAFSKAYRAVHFVRDNSTVLRRGFYVLEKVSGTVPGTARS
jgi:predicted GNAT superfamily acetyltransferase